MEWTTRKNVEISAKVLIILVIYTIDMFYYFIEKRKNDQRWSSRTVIKKIVVQTFIFPFVHFFFFLFLLSSAMRTRESEPGREKFISLSLSLSLFLSLCRLNKAVNRDKSFIFSLDKIANYTAVRGELNKKKKRKDEKVNATLIRSFFFLSHSRCTRRLFLWLTRYSNAICTSFLTHTPKHTNRESAAIFEH